VYSVAFILALLAFGGLAAYLGDLLGYRLGKRRLSLLRLRPRTTARLVAVLVGVLIPIVTVGLTSLVVPEVKDAVFRIDDLHRDIASLQSERDTVAGQRDSLRTEASQQRKAADQARADAAESRKDLSAVQSELTAARGHLAEARSRVAELRAQTERLGRDRRKAVGDRDEARKDLKVAETALRDAEKALDEADKKLAAATKSVKQAIDDKERLERERDRLKADRDDLVAEAQTLRQNLATLREQLTQVQREWELQHTIFSLRQPILERDTELVRGVIRRPPTVDELTDEVVKLLVLADTAAEAAGAGPNEKGRFTRAIFPVDPAREWERDELPPEEMVLGVVRRQLWANPADENVVQVKVAGRAFAGEAVHVRFEAQPNERVFRKDETIVTRELPAGLDEADALEWLWLVIADPRKSEVTRQARAARLLPDPADGRYGDITIRELYTAAHACAGRAQPVKVRVQAAEDAYTVGPLKIKVVVEPSGGE
jgi:uncharacterized protein (DUF3084 family)